MKNCLIFAIIYFSLTTTSLFAQILSIDEKKWLDSEGHISTTPTELTINKDEIVSQDTFLFQAFNQKKQLLIEGQYRVNDKKVPVKIGVWKFYYSSGQVQSERKYGAKGALVDIISLLSPDGKSLPMGYPYKNTDETYYGHMYRYNSEGDLFKIVRYSQGFVMEEFDLDTYPDSRLKQPKLRRYKISENEYLDEWSFEEVVELQKTDPKPIFMRMTYAWNGWSRKMTTIFAEPEIAETIKENYHLAYLDLGYDQEIKFTHNGEDLSFAPSQAKRYKVHGVASEFLGLQRLSTPTYILLDTNLEILGRSQGASRTQEKFLKHLRYYIDRHYKVMSYKEYTASNED